MKEIRIEQWEFILTHISQVMEDHASLLCEMDARMGDGDLGLTMEKGYGAMPRIFRETAEADMGKRIMKTGMKMASVVPSTMGTLMASGWMKGGEKLVGTEKVDSLLFARFLQGFADGIAKRGKCLPGDRTVLDALQPAAEAALLAAQQGEDLTATAYAALLGAQQGVCATRDMIPRFGKAAVFAAKARGTEDQGAVAGMLLVKGIYEAIRNA